MTAPAIHHVAGECQWCAGRGRVCDHPCLACEGTGSDSSAWVLRLFGYEPKDFRVTPRSHRVLVDTEEGTREIDAELEATLAPRAARGDDGKED